MSKLKPQVSVVIPSWNSEAQMRKNMPDVFVAAKKVAAEIVIVDDASARDRSYEYIQSLGNAVRAVRNEKNLGFAATVNKGVELAEGEYVILLNTDVRPEAECFFRALKYFEDESVYSVGFNSNEGMMGARWENGLFHHFRAEPKKIGNDSFFPTCWASGGQAAFDRKKWLEMGGMDVIYHPFYWEDTDMGYRSWKRGWKNVWAFDCRCVHEHRVSVIANNFSNKDILKTAQRNQFLFVWKNITDGAYLLSHFMRIPYFLLKYPVAVLQALAMLPQVLKARVKEQKCFIKKDREILNYWS